MNAEPGSASIGALNDADDPATTFGTPDAASHLTRSSLQNQYPRPLVWVIRFLTVAGRAGGRSTGMPLSKPVRTWISANSGQYSATGASRSRLPCSTCCSAATVHGILVIDMIRNRVPVVTGSLSPAARG